MEFTIAALLHLLVAESRDVIEKSDRARKRRHAVLDKASDYARGSLRTERDRTAALVLEGIHLFLYHIGGVADGSQEQVRLLKCRDTDLVISVLSANFCKSTLRFLPFVDFLRQNIFGALLTTVFHKVSHSLSSKQFIIH